MLEMKEMQKQIILTFVIAISSLYIGLIIGFISFKLMPGDKFSAWISSYGWHNNPYTNMLKHDLGYDLPIILQFIRYIGDLFAGYWGVSVSLIRSAPTYDLVLTRIPFSIDLAVISMLISVVIGGILGVESYRNKGELKGKLILIFSTSFISIPIVLLVMMHQYNIGPSLPTGYLSVQYDYPPFITGFLTVDAMITGQWHLIGDYILHIILPIMCFSIFMTSIIIWITRTYLIRKSQNKSTISIVKISEIILLLALIFMGLIEIAFGLTGVGKLYIDAIISLDYWVFNSILFILLITLISVISIIHLTFIVYKFLKENRKFSKLVDSQEVNNMHSEIEHSETKSDKILKKYIRGIFCSRIFIIAAILDSFLIIILFISQWLTSRDRVEYLQFSNIPDPSNLFFVSAVFVIMFLMVGFFFKLHKFLIYKGRIEWIFNPKVK